MAFLISSFSTLPAVFQDLIFNNSQFLRQHILSSLRDNFAATLETAARHPLRDAPSSFEALDYYVDPASAQILKFSALHAVSSDLQRQAGDPLPPTQLLPNMSTVLLQTEEERGGEQYLEAVATTLAAQIAGVLVPIDTILLASLLAEILGGSPEDHVPLFTQSSSTSSGGGSSSRKRSASATGRKMQLAWEALYKGLSNRQSPVVVYIKSADTFLCSSWERYDAFTSVFGGGSGSTSTGVARQIANMNTSPVKITPKDSTGNKSRLGGGGDGSDSAGGVSPRFDRLRVGTGPIVVVGGAILAERGAGLLSSNKKTVVEEGTGSFSNKPDSFSGGFFGGGGGLGGDDDDGAFSGSGSGLGGGFGDSDELGSLANVLLSLNRLIEEPRPDARKLLAAAFPTRVKLLPPPPGSAAATRHRDRVQRDVERQVEKDNYSRASAVAAATGVKVPARGSEIYSVAATAAAAAAGGGGGGSGFGSGVALSKDAWEKVLAWAVSIETLQNKKTELERKARGMTPPSITSSTLEKQLQDGTSGSSIDSTNIITSTTTVSNGNGIDPQKEKEEEEDDGVAVGLRQRHQQLKQQQEQENHHVSGIRRVFSAVNNSEEYYTNDITRKSLLGAPLPMSSLSTTVPTERKNILNKFFLLVDSILEKLPGGQFMLQTIFSIYTSFGISDRIAQIQNTMLRFVPPSSFSHKKNDGITTSTSSTTATTMVPKATQIDDDKALSPTDFGHFPPLILSESSLRYGLTMLSRSGGGPRTTIQPENSYEKQLLSEVLSPEDLGAGKGGASGAGGTPAGFSHVGALEDAKQVLQETVQLPLQRPDLFQVGALAKPPSGVLLFGPPGTGKTLLARATAAESGASFLELSLSSLSSKYYGDSTKLVRAAFTLAEKLAPCVLFIDEVDALLGRRSSTGREHEATRELKNEFMSRWDSIRTTTTTRSRGTGWVMVLGATNRPFDLDEAVLRRFSVRVAVELPDKKSRRDILNVILSGQPVEESVDVEKIAEETEGFSGADLRQLCVAAAMRPIRELVKKTNAASSDTAIARTGEEESVDNNESALTPIHSQIKLNNNSTSIDVVQLPSPQLAAAFTDATHLADGSGGGVFSTSTASAAGQKPRPVNQADFEAARRDVGPTVDPESSVIQELKEWDKKFGSVGGGHKRGAAGDSQLLYYT